MKEKLKLSFVRGVMLALGLTAGGLLSVAVTGTVNTFNSGDTLTSSLMNENFTSLKTAIESIPDWTKNGANAYYTAGNVGIGTATPDTHCNTNTKLCIVGGHIYNNGNNNILNRAGSSAWDTFGSTHFQIDGTTYSKIGMYDTSYLRSSSGLLVDGRVGIGVTNPEGSLEIAANNIIAGNPSVLLKGDYNTERFSIESSADAVFQTGQYGGSQASKTAVISGMPLGTFQAGGYDGVTQHYNRAAMYMYAGENFTPTATGTGIRFRTVPIGSTTKTDQVTITPNGNVGIGTTTPAEELHIQKSQGTDTAVRIDNSDANGLSILKMKTQTEEFHVGVGPNNVASPLYNKLYFWNQNGNILMVVDKDNKMGIKTTSPTEILDVNGCIKHNNGTLGTSCASDARLKKDISNLIFSNVLQKISAMIPRKYKYRLGEQNEYLGLVAQEVEKVAPELVGINREGFKTLDYTRIQWMQFQAIQELTVRLRSLNESQQAEKDKALSLVREFDKLKNQNKVLRSEMESLKIQNQELKSIYKRLEKLETRQRGN